MWVGWVGFEKYGKFHTFLFFIFDTFPNSLKMLKTDFEDLKAKMVIAMYSSTFGGKIQNMSRSFHAYTKFLLTCLQR